MTTLESSTTADAKPNGTDPKPNRISKSLNNNLSYSAAVSKGTPLGSSNVVAMATKQGFANTVNNSVRKQGIAFDAIPENVPVEDYLDAICKTVPSRTVTHISKVSRQIQVYFDSVGQAEKLISIGLDIHDYHLDVRPIATSPVKVIVSNVPPEIGHQWLRNEMSKYGRVVGPIKTLSAATSRPQYNHIKSFRRMVLMDFDNDMALEKIPKQMNFSIDGIPYSIYISVDVKCFKCGQIGHVRRNCPNVQTLSYREEAPVSESSSTVLEKASASIQESPTETENFEMEIVGQTEFPVLSQVTLVPPPKILAPPTDSTFEDSLNGSSKQRKKKRQQLKRRTSPPINESAVKLHHHEQSSNERTQSARNTLPKDHSEMDHHQQEQSSIEWTQSVPNTESEDHSGIDSDSSSQYSMFSENAEAGFLDSFTVCSPLSIDELVKFLNEVKGSPRRLFFAKKYTNDIFGLVKQLKNLGLFLKSNPNKSKNLTYARIQRVYSGLNEDLNSKM